jgi:hypothetical protein
LRNVNDFCGCHFSLLVSGHPAGSDPFLLAACWTNNLTSR